MLQRNELIFIELLLFNVVETDYVLLLVVLDDQLLEILLFGLERLDVSRTACEVVEDVTHLQVVQGQVALVDLGIGLLQQVDPDLV